MELWVYTLVGISVHKLKLQYKCVCAESDSAGKYTSTQL